MKFWQTLALTTATLTLSNLAQADFIGLYASADYWDLKGDYNETRKGTSFGDALDLEKKGQAQIALSFEHPVPLIPNARIRYTTLDVATKEKNAVNTPQYELNLDNTDFILYYEILDNIVSVDVGVAAKNLDGDVTYNDALYGQDRLKISKTAAMAYASVGLTLPFTGLSAKAEALATSYGDVNIADVSAEVKYNFIENMLINVGAKAGYRMLNIDLDDQEGIDNRFRFEGPYVGLEVHF